MSKKVPKKEEKSNDNAYKLSTLGGIFKLFKEKNNQDTKEIIGAHINNIISGSSILSHTTVIFIYNEINDYATDKIYKAISKQKQDNIILILDSPGGKIEPAYLISKCCKELARDKFKVVVPRRAKSAATLISLGADEIHMGKMSHLGPIDPQINGLPALGLSDAVDYLARLTTRFPDAGDMISKYLSNKLDLQSLGFFERVSESAVQYAKRLLKKSKLTDGLEVEDVAIKLVYSYKDHSFAIDDKEAKKYLAPMIKTDSEEYKIFSEIHDFIEDVKLVSKLEKKDFFIIGNIEDGMTLFNKED